MIELFYTLVALAIGMAFGAAGVFLATKKMSPTKRVCGWIAMVPAFFTTLMIVSWCEHQVHPRSFIAVFSYFSVAVVLLYSIFLGIMISLRKEIRKERKNVHKRSWINMACYQLLTTLPPIIWLILYVASLGDLTIPILGNMELSCWTALMLAITLGCVTAFPLWATMHLSWLIMYAGKSTPYKQ